MIALALSPDARRAFRMRSAAPQTYALLERIYAVKGQLPTFCESEGGRMVLLPLRHRLMVVQVALEESLSVGQEAPPVRQWEATALLRQADVWAGGRQA